RTGPHRRHCPRGTHQVHPDAETPQRTPNNRATSSPLPTLLIFQPLDKTKRRRISYLCVQRVTRGGEYPCLGQNVSRSSKNALRGLSASSTSVISTGLICGHAVGVFWIVRKKQLVHLIHQLL